MEKKTLWEKEKLLVAFPHSVFKRLELWTCKNQGLFGKGIEKKVKLFCTVKDCSHFEGEKKIRQVFVFFILLRKCIKTYACYTKMSVVLPF